MVSIAKKKQEKSHQRHQRNKRYKTLIKNHLREIRQQLAKGTNSLESLNNLFCQTQKVLDKAVSKGIIHKNNASRRKSKLSQQIKQLATA